MEKFSKFQTQKNFRKTENSYQLNVTWKYIFRRPRNPKRQSKLNVTGSKISKFSKNVHKTYYVPEFPNCVRQSKAKQSKVRFPKSESKAKQSKAKQSKVGKKDLQI